MISIAPKNASSSLFFCCFEMLQTFLQLHQNEKWSEAGGWGITSWCWEEKKWKVLNLFKSLRDYDSQVALITCFAFRFFFVARFSRGWTSTSVALRAAEFGDGLKVLRLSAPLSLFSPRNEWKKSRVSFNHFNTHRPPAIACSKWCKKYYSSTSKSVLSSANVHTMTTLRRAQKKSSIQKEFCLSLWFQFNDFSRSSSCRRNMCYHKFITHLL